MQRLQRFLAIPMAATAVACLWLLYRQAGSRGVATGVIAVVVLVAIFAMAGKLQRKGAGRVAIAAVLALAVGAAAVALTPERSAVAGSAQAGAEPWSEGRVASYLQQGHPVFVYFTADWCLTCKANEVAAIDRSEVRDAFKRADVKVLAGDWTNGDPAITRFLESRGRAGVPLYLWYSPGNPPEELPQILTPSMLISHARQP
jgi:thiol:disulfide interchange protein